METINRNNTIYYILFFGLLTVVILNLPYGYYILYPFMILDTWFHEFSHGITAYLLGANFERLVIFANGSGYAEYSYSSIFLGNIGRALIAGAGPIGPTIIGYIFLISSNNTKYSNLLLYILGFVLLFSTLIWVRPFIGFGFFVSIVFSIIFILIAFKGNLKFKQITLQLTGIQAFMSVYLNVGYLFSSGAEVGGKISKSDTQVIADNLFLPYWFWAVLIIIFSLYLLIKSIIFIIKKSKVTSIDKL